jgi:hypothetical protein
MLFVECSFKQVMDFIFFFFLDSPTMNRPLLYFIFTIQMHGLGVHVRCMHQNLLMYLMVQC